MKGNPNSILSFASLFPLTLLVALSIPSFSLEIVAPGKYPNLQAALDSAKPGDIVLLEPGRYRTQLTIPSGVTLQSRGNSGGGEVGLARAEATVIDGSGKVPVITLLEGSALNGLAITGAGKFNQSEFDRHHEERGENLTDDEGAVGIKRTHPALSISGVTATVRNCIVFGNGGPGIGVVGPSEAIIQNNFVYRNMGGGIGIANKAQAEVSGNHCWNNLRAGIGCRNASPEIFKNDCYQNVRAGIGIREGASPDVYDNRCYQNRRAGIGVRMLGTEPRLFRNHCYDNGMAGIGCRDQAAPVIFENECYRNRLAGIGAMSDAQPTIVANKLYDNEAAAIGLEACASGEVLILKNDISAKKLVGIGIQAGWTALIEDNRIRRQGGLPPLVMVFKGARADFLGNTLTGSGVAAIRCQGEILVGDNQFHCPAPRQGGPPQFAVWALAGSHVVMTDDNQIEGWREQDIPAVRVANREELESAIRVAQPGTTILLAPGNYQGDLTARNLRGTQARPITIAGADHNNPPVFESGRSGLHFIAPHYLTLRNLIVSNIATNGINIDDGGVTNFPAHHITLSHLTIKDHRGRGNCDGIKLSGLQDFRVESCRIEHWGKGGSGIDMVGCHNGLISRCFFEHDADSKGANGLQVKGGSRGVSVRRCRFKNAGGRAINLGGSTGADYFRPNDARAEASSLQVEDCLFEGSLAPLAFVGVDGAMVRNNTILEPRRWIVRILQENLAPHLARGREGYFQHNFVAFRSSNLAMPLNIGPSTEPQTFRFIDNEWLCLDGSPSQDKLLPFSIPETGGIFRKGGPRAEFDALSIQQVKTNPGTGVRWWNARRQ